MYAAATGDHFFSPFGLAGLAYVTARRVAGPYEALKRTFDKIKNGDLDERLHFRSHDGLEQLAASFNDMMDGLPKQIAEREDK